MPIPLALIYGESPNDTKALRHMVPALLPEETLVDCRPVREPGTLSKTASPRKRKMLARAIAIKAKHESTKRKVIVVVHEDCDDLEDAHVAQSEKVTAELEAEGVELVVPAIAAWEIEAWWMLFPEALSACRGCWSTFPANGRRVGLIENAKEFLIDALKCQDSRGKKCPNYSESDSERIAEEILKGRLCDSSQRLSRSRSLLAFRNALLDAMDKATA